MNFIIFVFSSFRTQISLGFVIASLSGTILRLPCKTIADFDVFHIGKRLLGHVLMSFNGLNDVLCMIKCIENAKCRSYNINTKDGRCEISRKALVDTGTALTIDSDWNFKTTDYKTTLVCLS